MHINTNWTTIKNIANKKQLILQYIEANSLYYVYAVDQSFSLECVIAQDGNSDQVDFETNYKSSCNGLLDSTVTTQYEKDDKVLKLARGYAAVDPNTSNAMVYVRVPGTIGSGQGRYMTGGYGISSDYNPDDFCMCFVEDKDRIIAMMVVRALDPNATVPLPDLAIQGMGPIPGLDISLPNYPIMQSYTDDEQPSANTGWYFWPLTVSNNIPAVGEVEINPIGGYGFAPAGFYIKIVYQRPLNITTGGLRVNIDWGKKA